MVLLLGGLALRLTIAYVLFPASGFESDLASYASWASCDGASTGPAGFYANAGFADYPPAYLYVLWPVGALARARPSSAGRADQAAADPARPRRSATSSTGWCAAGPGRARAARRWRWRRRRSTSSTRSRFYDSALWGQTDAAGALVLLLGLAALIRGNSEGAAAFAATAALVKPQFGVVLIPLVALGAHQAPPAATGLGPAPSALGAAPAGALADRASRAGCGCSPRSAAAWAAFFVDRPALRHGPAGVPRAHVRHGRRLRLPHRQRLQRLGPAGRRTASPRWPRRCAGTTTPWPLLGPIPGVAIGAALLVAGFLWGAVRGAVRDDRWTLIVAATFLAIAFFILPTRVHERYIFPAVALMPLLAVVQRPLGRGPAAAEHRCLHQPPRHPDAAAVRQRQRRDPAPGRVVPYAAAHHRSRRCCRPVWACGRRGSCGPALRTSPDASMPRGSGTDWRRARAAPATPVPAAGGRRRPACRPSRGDWPGRCVAGAAEPARPPRGPALLGIAAPRPQRRAGFRARRAHRPPRPAGARRAGGAHARRCAASASTSRRACTSTRSTTPAPPRSSCSTGSTASPTTSTSSPTPTWPSTPWPGASASPVATRSPVRPTWACPSRTPRSSARWCARRRRVSDAMATASTWPAASACWSTTWPRASCVDELPLAATAVAVDERCAPRSTRPIQPGASTASTPAAFDAQRFGAEARPLGHRRCRHTLLVRAGRTGRAAARHRHAPRRDHARLHRQLRHRHRRAALGATRRGYRGRRRAALGRTADRGHEASCQTGRPPPHLLASVLDDDPDAASTDLLARDGFVIVDGLTSMPIPSMG